MGPSIKGEVYTPTGIFTMMLGLSRRRYFYDDDANNTLMCSMDERFVGFATATDPESVSVIIMWAISAL